MADEGKLGVSAESQPAAAETGETTTTVRMQSETETPPAAKAENETETPAEGRGIVEAAAEDEEEEKSAKSRRLELAAEQDARVEIERAASAAEEKEQEKEEEKEEETAKETKETAVIAEREKGNAEGVEESQHDNKEVSSALPPVSEKQNRIDYKSELLAAKSWGEIVLHDGTSHLPDDLLKGVYAKGWSKPSKVQEVALPFILGSCSNLIAQAQNGSGKTATFALSILAKTEFSISSPQSMCLAPTRELAKQNADVISELGKFTPIKVFVMVPQCLKISRGDTIHAIVGTPGKVREFVQKRTFDISHIKLFVLDEADVMIDNEASMGQQVIQIMKMLPTCQSLLFSATFPDRVRKFAGVAIPKASKIQLKKEDLTLKTISQFYRIVQKSKLESLSELYSVLSVGQSVVFVNRRTTALQVARYMKDQGHSVSMITGTQKATDRSEAFSVEQREKVMDDFRRGATRVLIATDVLARGIDVPEVTLVVNYDLPFSPDTGAVEYETYLHRVGRTGRFGQRGIAVSFLESQADMNLIESIESYYGCKISELESDIDELETMMRDLRL